MQDCSTLCRPLQAGRGYVGCCTALLLKHCHTRPRSGHCLWQHLMQGCLVTHFKSKGLRSVHPERSHSHDKIRASCRAACKLTCTALRWCSRSLSAALRRGAAALLRRRWARPVLARLLGRGSSPSDSSVACSASGWVEQWLPAVTHAVPCGGLLKCKGWQVRPCL